MKNVARNSIFGFGLAVFFHFISLGLYVWEYHEMHETAYMMEGAGVDFAIKVLFGVFLIFCVLFSISFRRVLNDET